MSRLTALTSRLNVIDQEEFVADALARFDSQARGFGEFRETDAIDHRGGRATAENAGTQRNVELVHELRLEQSRVNLPTTFAQEPVDLPFFPQPTQCEI